MRHSLLIRSRTSFLTSLFLIGITLIFCTKKSAGSSITPPVTSADTMKYQLVWSDEFNGTVIDSSTWTFEMGNNGWGNNELEYYQKANAAITDGNLVITAKKESMGTAPYTSARIKTEGKKSFTYGRIEARMKLPVGQGLWPAFWMLGANIASVSWPTCGEIDIMEHINADSLLYGTAHWNNNGHVSSGGKTNFLPSEYHVYDVEWTTSAITWHIDGVAYWKTEIANGVSNTTAFQKSFFILFNLAVGGNWPGNTVDDTKFPARMYVDYVRVYQLK